MGQTLFRHNLTQFIDGVLKGESDGSKDEAGNFGDGRRRQRNLPAALGFVLEEAEWMGPPMRSDSKADRSAARRALYRKIVSYLYGYLGKGNRVKLEKCITDGVRSLYPDPDDEFL